MQTDDVFAPSALNDQCQLGSALCKGCEVAVQSLLLFLFAACSSVCLLSPSRKADELDFSSFSRLHLLVDSVELAKRRGLLVLKGKINKLFDGS